MWVTVILVILNLFLMALDIGGIISKSHRIILAWLIISTIVLILEIVVTVGFIIIGGIGLDWGWGAPRVWAPD